MKVLVLGTSRKAKGGINSVIDAYSRTELWNSWECYWLETHIDKGIFHKIAYLILSLFKFLIMLPSYQIVHIHLSEPPSVLRKSIFLFIAKLFNRIVIAHFHSFSTETTIDGNSQKLYFKFFLKSDKIIVLSERWYKWIAQKWPEFSDKIIVLSNPCPDIVLESSQVKTKTILFAGALIIRKGYMDLIKGFSLIADKHKDWSLVFAGNGEIQKAKRLATDLRIETQVVFKGWVSGNEKDTLFRRCSIFCLPSYAEGFPMAVLEAWAYGLPVITTLVGGLPDIIIKGKNACVVEPGNQEQIAQMIEALIIDESLRHRLSEEAINLSKTSFNINKLADKLNNIYTALLRN